MSLMEHVGIFLLSVGLVGLFVWLVHLYPVAAIFIIMLILAVRLL